MGVLELAVAGFILAVKLGLVMVGWRRGWGIRSLQPIGLGMVIGGLIGFVVALLGGSQETVELLAQPVGLFEFGLQVLMASRSPVGRPYAAVTPAGCRSPRRAACRRGRQSHATGPLEAPGAASSEGLRRRLPRPAPTSATRRRQLYADLGGRLLAVIPPHIHIGRFGDATNSNTPPSRFSVQD